MLDQLVQPWIARGLGHEEHPISRSLGAIARCYLTAPKGRRRRCGARHPAAVPIGPQPLIKQTLTWYCRCPVCCDSYA
jgi:hypothetical protein